jgi:hypothetical protein
VLGELDHAGFVVQSHDLAGGSHASAEQIQHAQRAAAYIKRPLPYADTESFEQTLGVGTTYFALG